MCFCFFKQRYGKKLRKANPTATKCIGIAKFF